MRLSISIIHCVCPTTYSSLEKAVTNLFWIPPRSIQIGNKRFHLVWIPYPFFGYGIHFLETVSIFWKRFPFFGNRFHLIWKPFPNHLETLCALNSSTESSKRDIIWFKVVELSNSRQFAFILLIYIEVTCFNNQSFPRNE